MPFDAPVTTPPFPANLLLAMLMKSFPLLNSGLVGLASFRPQLCPINRTWPTLVVTTCCHVTIDGHALWLTHWLRRTHPLPQVVLTVSKRTAVLGYRPYHL